MKTGKYLNFPTFSVCSGYWWSFFCWHVYLDSWNTSCPCGQTIMTNVIDFTSKWKSDSLRTCVIKKISYELKKWVNGYSIADKDAEYTYGMGLVYYCKGRWMKARSSGERTHEKERRTESNSQVQSGTFAHCVHFCSFMFIIILTWLKRNVPGFRPFNARQVSYEM